MKALKILVVEDDVFIANDIAEQLIQFGYAITDVVHNSEDAIKAFKKRLPDMVMMDIRLQDSDLDGIQIAENFNAICRVPIIYLTSFYDLDTRQRAKKTNPVNYLLKPYTPEQLEVAIDVAFSNYFDQNKSGLPCFKNKGYFFIKNGNRYVRYEEADILWVKGGGYGSSIEIFTQEEHFVFSASLQDFERQLCTNTILRVHRSYMVNINHVIAIERERLIVLRLGKEEYVPTSKEYPLTQQHFLRIKSN